MMHWDYDGGAGSWLAMIVVMLLSWVALATLSYAVVRALLAGERPAPGRGPEPDELLAQRLARGDIDPQDYRRRKDLLIQRSVERDVKTG